VLLALDRPRSTTDIARALGVTAGGASQHLAVLRDAGLVHGHRVGRVVLYCARPPATTCSPSRPANVDSEYRARRRSGAVEPGDADAAVGHPVEHEVPAVDLFDRGREDDVVDGARALFRGLR
jgi:hypothetical protein